MTRVEVGGLIDDTSSTTSSFRDRGLEAALDAIGEAGFPQAEICEAEEHVGTPSDQEISRIRNILEAHSVRGRTMHAPLRSTLATMDAVSRNQSVETLKELIRMAGALNLTDLVVHPTNSRELAPYADDPQMPQRVRESVVRSLDEIMPVIEQSTVRIIIENLPYTPIPFASMAELRSLVEPYPTESVGLIVDIGHAYRLDRDPADEIRASGSRLCGTHIHGVNVNAERIDHYSPTMGDLDWDAIRQAYADIDYKGPWTSEAFKPSDGQSPEELAREVRDWMTAWLS
jgi:sugar phosphate isomerase/epimerase